MNSGEAQLAFRIGEVAHRFQELGRQASREAAISVVAALHEEGVRFRQDMQQVAEGAEPSAEQAIEAAVQCFDQRVELVLSHALEMIARYNLPLEPHAARAAGALEHAASSSRSPVRPSPDDLEALLRSTFKSLGCSTVAVLDRCRLGDRGVGAKLPSGTWMQAWINGGHVLWVLPNIPQLTELVRNPAVSSAVLARLLQHGSGRKESFFLSQQQPLCVGYKFGPLHHQELMSSPAVLGSRIEDAITMVQQQATILALECQMRLSATQLGQAGSSGPLAGSAEAGGMDFNSELFAAPSPWTAPGSRGEEVPQGDRDLEPRESAAVPVGDAPAGLAEKGSERRPPQRGRGSQAEAEEEEAAASAGAELPTSSSASGAASGAPTAAAPKLETLASVGNNEDRRLAEQWFKEARRQYLDPQIAAMVWEEEPKRSFEVSVQDSPKRKVGKEFIRKTDLNFEHFRMHAAEYVAAAEAQGFHMDVAPHEKGHHRLRISWTDQVASGTEGEEAAGPHPPATAPPSEERRAESCGSEEQPSRPSQEGRPPATMADSPKAPGVGAGNEAEAVVATAPDRGEGGAGGGSEGSRGSARDGRLQRAPHVRRRADTAAVWEIPGC